MNDRINDKIKYDLENLKKKKLFYKIMVALVLNSECVAYFEQNTTFLS